MKHVCRARLDGKPVGEHQQWLVARQYAAVCAPMRGLTRMRLWESYDTLCVLNAMVLPCLLDIVDLNLCANRATSCSGLERLELRNELECNYKLLQISLSDANTLRTVSIKMPQYSRLVEVRITGHDPAAGIVPSVEVSFDDEYHIDYTRLIITLGEGRAQHEGQGAACVRFRLEGRTQGDDGVWVAQPVSCV